MPPLLSQCLVFLLTTLSILALSEVDTGSGHETTFIVSEEVPKPVKSIHLKPHLDIEDVFPEECPTDKQTTEAVLLCRARVAWERSVNRLFPKKSSKKARAKRTKDKRLVKKTDGTVEDCLMNRRTEPRPYPHYCYGRGNFTWEEFANQWQMIRGDLMYTFDFVLYDQRHPSRKENQLWYLVSYLKELAGNIDNPIDLVEAVKMSSATRKQEEVARRNRFAKKNLKALATRVEKLEKLVQHTRRWSIYN